MSCLPVVPDEIEEFERRMGVRLPPYYKSKMSDVRVQRALASKGVGMLRPRDTMRQYAEMTELIRLKQPEFPRDGVLMLVPIRENGEVDFNFGYSRFFLPDKNDPSRLADVVYAWDSSSRRKTRDCSTEQFIGSSIDCADATLLSELGLEKSGIWDPKPPQIKECDAELLRLLSLRGIEATETSKEIEGKWIHCADLSYRGNYLSPCDLGQVPDVRASISVPIKPGLFKAEVQLQASSLGSWLILARMRVISGTPDYGSSQEVGLLDIDLAAMALFDRQAFFRKVPVDDRESVGMDLLEVEVMPCVMMLGRTPILVIPTGDGDGTYPVLALRDGEKPIGIEIQFKNEVRP